MKTRIKICGLTREEDVDAAVAATERILAGKAAAGAGLVDAAIRDLKAKLN